MSEKKFDKNYWNSRWENSEIGWDIGFASTAISEYFLQVENKEIKILIPGCGNAHEAELLLEKGFKNITLLDIAPKACEIISKKFLHHTIEIVCEDFFKHQGKYDIIVEQTFFCALNPDFREKYMEKMYELLHDGGKIIGVLFNKDFERNTPPFGGNIDEYKNLFEKKFKIKTLENCYNSIKPRQNTEIFINFQKQNINSKKNKNYEKEHGSNR